MSFHADLVVNDWDKLVQRRVVAVHANGSDVKIETFDPSFDLPLPERVFAPGHAEGASRFDDPASYVGLLHFFFHGSGLFATEAHDVSECRFVGRGEIPMPPARSDHIVLS